MFIRRGTMPKVYLTETERRNELSRVAINVYLAKRSIKKRDFGKRIGATTATGYNKIKDPSRLTVGDLRAMKLTEEELIQIVG
jgi:hypothetical protein